ncbi:hypothetical protein [Mycobacteroides abscessus]|uniref:hypothetical protein n=1 Tax=Mycobacteroides abscessus TaxID=36809 RepID=UPI001055E4F2|nr:hypothetical protein [Mycobacteroides abscessus]
MTESSEPERLEISAPTMREIKVQYDQLTAEGWVLVDVVKPLLEGVGGEPTAVFERSPGVTAEPYFAPRPGWTPLRDAPGWGPFYRHLQADVAALDPTAQVQILQRPHRLHLHVVEAKPEVLQAVKDLCYDAEAASLRTCQVCGEPGQVRLAEDESRWRVRCDDHTTILSASLPLADDLPGWRTRVDRLIDALAAVDPGSVLMQITASGTGPKGLWRGASAAGQDVIRAALQDLGRICGRCGTVSKEWLGTCSSCGWRP